MEGVESIQSVGIVNALKTGKFPVCLYTILLLLSIAIFHTKILILSNKLGNMVVDMVIAMLIPVILGSLFSGISYLSKMISEIDWKSFFTKNKKLYERYITHKTMTTAYSTTDLGSGDSQNEVLIKAIQLYLDHHNLLKLRCADLELRQLDKDDSKNRGYYYYYDEEQNSTTLADTLAKYKIVKNPLKRVWLNVGKYPSTADTANSDDLKKEQKEFEVHLIVTENKEDINNKDEGSSSLKHRHELQMRFTSEGKNSIDVFIEKAYTWYISQLRTMEDNSRYLYELSNSKSSEDDDDSKRKYKRYQLSDEKTFESLFFKEKENVLKVVNHFTKKTGKYQIKGYPNKLGLLLHGPPGTGKNNTCF